MNKVVVQLVAVYSALAAVSAAVIQYLGGSWFGFGVLWIAVTGFTQFMFAFALEKRAPRAFIWTILGGGMLRMLLAAATVIVPKALAQAPGYESILLQFAAVYFLAQGLETWIAVRRIS